MAPIVDTSPQPERKTLPGMDFCREIERFVLAASSRDQPEHRRSPRNTPIANRRIGSTTSAALGAKQGDFVGIYFNDSDVYKWLEAAASSNDPKLQKMIDDTIDVIAAAQQPDGYLNTYFMFDLAKERWTNLKDKHEMYLPDT